MQIKLTSNSRRVKLCPWSNLALEEPLHFLSTWAQLHYKSYSTWHTLHFCYTQCGLKLSLTHCKSLHKIFWNQPYQPHLEYCQKLEFQLFPKLHSEITLIYLYNFKFSLSMKWNWTYHLSNATIVEVIGPHLILQKLETRKSLHKVKFLFYQTLEHICVYSSKSVGIQTNFILSNLQINGWWTTLIIRAWSHTEV